MVLGPQIRIFCRCMVNVHYASLFNLVNTVNETYKMQVLHHVILMYNDFDDVELKLFLLAFRLWKVVSVIL